MELETGAVAMRWMGDQRTRSSFSLPWFALSGAVDWHNSDIIGGEGSKASQHGGRVATGHLCSQLPPSSLGFVGDTIVEYIARCRLPRHLHGLIRLLCDCNHFTSSRDCEGKRKVEKEKWWMDGLREKCRFWALFRWKFLLNVCLTVYVSNIPLEI